MGISVKYNSDLPYSLTNSDRQRRKVAASCPLFLSGGVDDTICGKYCISITLDYNRATTATAPLYPTLRPTISAPFDCTSHGAAGL